MTNDSYLNEQAAMRAAAKRKAAAKAALPQGAVCLHNFPGFYGSWLSDALDREEESYIEYTLGEAFEYEHDRETWFERARVLHKLDQKRAITDEDLADALMKHTYYGEARRSAANVWVDAFAYAFDDMTRSELWCTFESMSSPRYYNFETDRVFVNVPMARLKAIHRVMLKGERRAALEKEIARRFTSRDGFISYYPNELSEWEEKPLDEWDHNELGTLVAAYIESSSGYDDDEFDGEIRDFIMDHDGLYHEWSGAVDWDALKKHMTELIEERIEGFYEENPDERPELKPQRCTETRDLFADAR